MNLRKLKIFYETAIHLNMTKVAREMYVSQPSISQSINEIEMELNVKLFDRIGKRLCLTHEGEIFLSYVTRILNLYDEGVKRITDINLKEKDKLVIGASTTIGIYILPEIIKNFSSDFKDIEISLIIENTKKIEGLILNNKVDFAFVEGEITSDEIKKEVMWKDELVFICGNENNLRFNKEISGRELENHKLIMREKGSGTREESQLFFKRNKLKVRSFLELGSNEAIIKAVESNLGIGCLSYIVINDKINEKKIHTFRLNEGKIERDLSLILHRDKVISKNMKIFIDYSKRYISK